MRAVRTQRWETAQRLELDFWKHWTEAALYRGFDVPQYWSGELARLDCTTALFDGRRVLDVGCGPVGLIHFLDNAAERIRLDPLLPAYKNKLPLARPQLSLAALGESLPLASAAIDVAICFNALDHMRDPAAALDELARVLRPGGALLLMIHTFPPGMAAFFWVDRMHPHHWTAPGFLEDVRARFAIRHTFTTRRRFDMPARRWLLPSSWKYLAGKFVVASTYVRAERPLA